MSSNLAEIERWLWDAADDLRANSKLRTPGPSPACGRGETATNAGGVGEGRIAQNVAALLERSMVDR